MIGALVLLLQTAAPAETRYEDLVAEGLAQARSGQPDAARETLDRAIRLDAHRPEALVERAGLDFLEKRYDAAADGLGRALALKDDAYARDLRASALQLAGRSDEALDEWNRLGQPLLGQVRLTGLAKTRDRVARRELALVEGELVRAEAFRETRLRLREVGVFPRVRLRAVPREDRRADVEVALVERHGLGSWQELLVSGAANAFREQVRLRYANVAGEGIVLRAEYKWERTQPHVLGAISWPRPFGLPARLLVSGFRARPTYALDTGRLTLRTRGADVALRRVVGARTVVEAGWRLRERTFTASRPDTRDGTISAATTAIERSLVDTRRHRLGATLRGLVAIGSDVRFTQATAALHYQLELSRPDDSAIPPSTLAARALFGRSGEATPLDALFEAGAGSDADYPLRGHKLKDGGVLGGAPIGRSIALLNVEWRRRLWSRSGVQVGAVAFGDVIQITRRSAGEDGSLTDVGVGLRIGWSGSRVFRVDYGRSLSGDGRSAWSAGYGQAF